MTIFNRSLFCFKGNKNNVHWLSFSVEAFHAVRPLKITQLSNDLLYCILWNVTFFGCLPSLLLRCFVFLIVEASAKRERLVMNRKQGTMGRVQTVVSPVVSFPPSFARTFSSRERRLGTKQLFTGIFLLNSVLERLE